MAYKSNFDKDFDDIFTDCRYFTGAENIVSVFSKCCNYKEFWFFMSEVSCILRTKMSVK